MRPLSKKEEEEFLERQARAKVAYRVPNGAVAIDDRQFLHTLLVGCAKKKTTTKVNKYVRKPPLRILCSSVRSISSIASYAIVPLECKSIVTNDSTRKRPARAHLHDASCRLVLHKVADRATERRRAFEFDGATQIAILSGMSRALMKEMRKQSG